MERGDILRFRGPRSPRGHEQAGPRLAVVVQSAEFWPASTLTVAPTSQSARPRGIRPEISVGDERTTVMIDQISTYDTGRFAEHVGHVSRAELDEIEKALIRFFGLSGRFRRAQRVQS